MTASAHATYSAARAARCGEFPVLLKSCGPRCIALRPPAVEFLMIRRWRRLDEPGLGVLRLHVTGDGVQVKSSIVYAGEEPFGLRYV